MEWPQSRRGGRGEPPRPGTDTEIRVKGGASASARTSSLCRVRCLSVLTIVRPPVIHSPSAHPRPVNALPHHPSSSQARPRAFTQPPHIFTALSSPACPSARPLLLLVRDTKATLLHFRRPIR